jgi:hypothetical protein
MKRAALLLLVLAGCSNTPSPPAPKPCSEDPRAEMFALGVEKQSEGGAFKVRLEETTPSPPKLGDNFWTLVFLDANGAPLAVEAPRLNGSLLDRDQQTIPRWSYALPLDMTGRYRVGPFNMFTEGLWEFTIEAAKNGAGDRAQLRFCVQGRAEDAGVVDAGAAAPIECNVTAPTSCTDPAIDYEAVEPIIMERCLFCHDGMHDQWPLTSYDHVVDWFAEIRGAMIDCSMPPLAAQIPMSTIEREKILLWIRCGYPP